MPWIGGSEVNDENHENTDAACDANVLRHQRDLILAATGDGIYGLDAHGKTTFVNPAAARACGYTNEEMLGGNLHDMIHHTRPDGRYYHVHDCPIYAATNDGRIHRISDEVFWRKDGSSFPVEYVSTPIWDNGHLAGAVVSFRDITERKLAEENMRELQAELHHISRLGAMGEMASAMAHELNQPLAAIMNYIQACGQIIQADGADAHGRASEYIDKALAQATRAGDIIRGLRSFVTKSDDEKSFEHISEIVAESLLLTISSTVKERIRVDLNVPEELPEIFVHKIKIQQVIVNLVRNALEAMSEAPAGILEITGREIPGGYLKLSVGDNGPGLGPQQKLDVFEPFSTTKQQGMGIGLSICRSIIEEHDGKIWAESNVFGGATFSFILPDVPEGNNDDA